MSDLVGHEDGDEDTGVIAQEVEALGLPGLTTTRGDDVGIQDEESWLEAIKLSGTDRLKRAGAWYTIVSDSGKEFKFQGSKWIHQLKDEEFRNTVYDIMDKEIIEKYDTDGSDINVDSE